MRVVDAEEDNAGVGCSIDDDFVVEFRDRNLTCRSVDVQENFAENSRCVFQRCSSSCSAVNFQIDITGNGQSSKIKCLLHSFSFSLHYFTNLVPSSTAPQLSALN